VTTHCTGFYGTLQLFFVIIFVHLIFKYIHFQTRSRSREKHVLSSCPSVGMCQRCLHWTDFSEIWCWGLSWKSHICWKSGRDIGRLIYFCIVARDINCPWKYFFLQQSMFLYCL